MLLQHERWLLIDQAKKNDFNCEVNFREGDEATNKCQIFKFIFPDGKESFIKRDDLLQILFACGKPEDQQKMIPQKIQHIRNYETVLGITATRNIMKGQKINVRVKIPLPKMEEEIIAEIKTMAGKGQLGQYNIPIIKTK